MLSPFHLAIPVTDLSAARRFYGDVLGCAEGRSAPEWVDFDFRGHQLVCHLVSARASGGSDAGHNAVDGQHVPVPHFGLVLEWDAFDDLAERMNRAAIAFVIAPVVRFAGLPGEQKTCFVRDPAGNALEFKAFKSPDQLFAK